MEGTKQVEGSGAAAQSCCAPAGKAAWLSPRNVLIGAIALGGATGLLFGWNWLVAAGFASVILGLLPCLVMCALGMCMSRMGGKDASGATATPATKTEPQLPPPSEAK